MLPISSHASAAIALPADHPTGEDSARWIAQEHAVLVRRLARLQKQISQLVLNHEAQLQHWQQQLMRQSILLMLERTRGDWGLSGQVARRLTTGDRQVAHTLAHAAADALICRTGCAGDGHHWRDGEVCRLSGQACVAADTATGQAAINRKQE